MCMCDMFFFPSVTEDDTTEDTPLLYRRVSVSHTRVDPEVAILQASVFIEDGIHYRSIHHKIDPP